MVNDRDKYFVFNGKKSSDFGVWASGNAIFSKPMKRYEQIEVPGRNGDIILEDGSYQNVELEFKDCFIPKEFPNGFNNLTNYLYRQKGYKRLELSWLPDEYRMAAFEGDIEADLEGWNGYGQFDMSFTCKPQRFLKSGEEPIVLMNWADCSTIDYSSNTYYGKTSGQISIVTGSGCSLSFEKTSDSAEDITLYVTWWKYDADQSAYEDPISLVYTTSASITDTATWDSSSISSSDIAEGEWLTISFITTSDDTLTGWNISIDFTDDDGTPIHGIFADSIDIINPTGFTTYPLIVSKLQANDNWTAYAMFYPGITFSYENDEGDFVDKYSLSVEYSTSSRSYHGSCVYLDCENQYSYCKEADSTTETGYAYTTYDCISTVDSATGAWAKLTFPALTDKTTRISYPSDEVRGNAYNVDDTQPYELLADGDMYKAIYPRWYTI